MKATRQTRRIQALREGGQIGRKTGQRTAIADG
jgi:hypothetical protein